METIITHGVLHFLSFIFLYGSHEVARGPPYQSSIVFFGGERRSMYTNCITFIPTTQPGILSPPLSLALEART